jgi:hypothetical protein
MFKSELHEIHHKSQISQMAKLALDILALDFTDGGLKFYYLTSFLLSLSLSAPCFLLLANSQ